PVALHAPAPPPSSPLSLHDALPISWSSPRIASPMAVPSMSLAGKIHRARLADDDDLDLAGILQLALDLAGDLVGQLGRPAVVDGVGRHDDPHLAPRLNREHLLDARELAGELLQLGE